MKWALINQKKEATRTLKPRSHYQEELLGSSNTRTWKSRREKVLLHDLKEHRNTIQAATGKWGYKGAKAREEDICRETAMEGFRVNEVDSVCYGD